MRSKGVFLFLFLLVFSCATVRGGEPSSTLVSGQAAAQLQDGAKSVLEGTPPKKSPEKRRALLVAPNLTGKLLEVHFLDIGQGDCALIKTPGDKHYLIDTGNRSARKKILPYLRYLKIDRLDGIVISHSHSDHVGSLLEILKNVPVLAVYSSGYFHENKYNLKVLKYIEKNRIPFKTLRRRDRLELDQGVMAEVLHPPRDWDPEKVDLNDFSVVLRLSYGEVDFLFTGDCEKKCENSILAQKLAKESEFLKVGHHGARTSSTDAFLDSVRPLYAVISCGVNNPFGHPHKSTLDRLQLRNITIMRTDESGTIAVYTNGKRIMIKIKGKGWVPVSLFIRGWHDSLPVFVFFYGEGGRSRVC